MQSPISRDNCSRLHVYTATIDVLGLEQSIRSSEVTKSSRNRYETIFIDIAKRGRRLLCVCIRRLGGG